MTEIDIVNIYCKLTGNYYVLHKQIISNPVSKAYKTYSWTLYEIDNKIEVFNISNSYRIIDKNTEKAEKEMTELLLIKLFELYESYKTGKL